MASSPDRYVIPINGRWSLEDLYRFPRAFEQTYFALEAIAPTETSENEARITRAFEAFPWRGGYSAVSFYNQLKVATPIQHRPVIARIQYSSPGVIELYLNLPLALHVGSVVASVAGSISICNKVYHNIYSDLQRRRLLRLELERKNFELANDELKAVLDMSETMSRILQVPTASYLHDRTKDPLKSIKVLMSVYRRVRILAEFKNKKKADLRSVEQMIEDGDL